MRLLPLATVLVAVSAGPARAITNGTPATADDAVVGVLSGGAVICTGTLVAPAVVVTAGHCVSEGADAIFTGASLAEANEIVAVARVATAPGYEYPSLDADLGLLGLARPAGPAPLVLAGEPGGLEGAAVRIVGFGATGDDPTTIGRKHEGQTRIASVDAATLTVHPEPSQMCAGDSGGPVLMVVDGVEVIVGVASSGDVHCDRYAKATRVDGALAAFVAGFVAAAEEDEGGCSAAGRGSPASSVPAAAAVALVLALLLRHRRGGESPSRARSAPV